MSSVILLTVLANCGYENPHLIFFLPMHHNNRHVCYNMDHANLTQCTNSVVLWISNQVPPSYT